MAYAHDLLFEWNTLPAQKFLHFLARFREEVEIDVALFRHCAGEDRADQVGAKWRQQLHLSQRYESQVHQSLRQRLFLVKTEKPLQFAVDFGIGGEMRAEGEHFFRAEWVGCLALRIAVLAHSLLIHDPRRFP